MAVSRAASRRRAEEPVETLTPLWPPAPFSVPTVPWLAPVWQRLMRLQQQDRLPHGLLLLGAPGQGVVELARHFADWLLCLQPIHTPGNERACGVCSACQWRLAGSHPDLLWVKAEAGKEIGVDDIRGLIDAFAMTRQGALRVALIEQAEQMSRSAANSLLKLLEEPPVGSVFLLTATSAERLPATIRSRVQRFAPSVPSAATRQHWLVEQRGISADEAALLIFLGDSGLLDGQVPDWDWQGIAEAWLMLWQAPEKLPLVVQRWQTVPRPVLAQWLLRLWTASAQLRVGLPSDAPPALLPLLRRLAAQESALDAQKRYRILMAFAQTATHPLNEELALERLALDLIRQDLPEQID
ncbi:DNA polymerase III subunit [Halothiobacillus sp. DCM-1]|uniref:DNA polymerase III subunit n=1 Tax=Halothiobacillus sp. DCM-1 TaxID=3112558 RepID=UPI0032553ABD